MPDTVHVFDPTGSARVTEVHAAARPASLNGLRPGILENRKANAHLLMETMVDALREYADLGPLCIGSKPVAGPPPQPVFDKLVKEADFILVGSCD